MNLYSRFSAVYLVPDEKASLDTLEILYYMYISIRPPLAVRVDQAFEIHAFPEYLKSFGIELIPVPSKNHQKINATKAWFYQLNGFKTEKCIYRLKYLNSSASSCEYLKRLELFKHNIMSSFDIDKGYTKPLIEKMTTSIVSQD